MNKRMMKVSLTIVASAVDALAASSVAISKVATLDDKSLNDAMKRRRLVVEFLPSRRPDTFLAGT